MTQSVSRPNEHEESEVRLENLKIYLILTIQSDGASTQVLPKHGDLTGKVVLQSFVSMRLNANEQFLFFKIFENSYLNFKLFLKICHIFVSIPFLVHSSISCLMFNNVVLSLFAQTSLRRCVEDP